MRKVCLVPDVVIRVNATGLGERIGQGQIVDLGRVLVPASSERPAYTLGDALLGREDCFGPVEDEPAATLSSPRGRRAVPQE